MSESKALWRSKTLWIAIANIALSLDPFVQKWISENPGLASSIISATFIALRFVTTKPVVVKKG